MRKVHVALIHWPVLDRAKNIVCTNVTNFDIHDIARACRTYGVEKYFIINRMKEQLMFVSRVLDHWRVGWGAKYNPKRKTALDMVSGYETLEDLLRQYDEKPFIITTSARDRGLQRLSFEEVRSQIFETEGPPILLVFGTGFGLEDSVFEQADALLAPIKGASHDDYRHLSVRSAVSICLDRLMGS